MSLLQRWRAKVREFKVNVVAVYLAAGDPRVPWYARALAIAVAAYAFSPLDLIPDFIPVLGYLDDLVLLPLGIAWVIRMVPEPVWEECRARASEDLADRRLGRAAAVVVVLIWIALVLWLWALIVSGPWTLGR